MRSDDDSSVIGFLCRNYLYIPLATKFLNIEWAQIPYTGKNPHPHPSGLEPLAFLSYLIDLKNIRFDGA